MNDTTDSTTGADGMRPAPRVPENRLHRIGSASSVLQAAPPVPLVSRFPSLCCTESEDSIDGEFNLENSEQLRLCFLFQPSVFFLIETRCTAHCHLQCVSANLANRASPALSVSMSMSMSREVT